MRKDFDLIVRTINEDTIKIYPIADIHYGSIEHNEKAWQSFCDKISEEKNSYIILGGDLINNNTRSAVGSPFDDTVRPMYQKKIMAEMLKPIKDKILCAVSGNHERRSLKDADSDITYDIMSKLDLEDIYRPNMAFLKCIVGKKEKKTAYSFCITHGGGGGIFTGATVNRNERFGNVIDGMDCLIVGHTHKATVTRPSKIVIDNYNEKVTLKDYLVISCCSWQSFGGYAMQKMLLPSETAKPQALILNDTKGLNKRIGVEW